MGTGIGVTRRDHVIDIIKTAAIFGTLMIHASAMGGFAWPIGSVNWVVNLVWSSLLRCAVPLFFMCSGALLLPPEKEVSVSSVWRRYILRILIALFFWAAVYVCWDLLLGKLRTGVVEMVAIQQAGKDLLRFNHKDHLYYLHITLLLYALLPVLRLFAAKADRRLLRYALAVWFVLSSLWPTLRGFAPFSQAVGIPVQYAVNVTWGSLGYALLGFVLRQEAQPRRPRMFLAVYLTGLAISVLGTWAVCVQRESLYLGLLQGNAPGVCLQAAGLFGLCVSTQSKRPPSRAAAAVSGASFCIYLVHMILMDYLVFRGISSAVYPPIWSVPCLTAASFLFGFAVWLVLRKIPLVNRYLI